MMVRKLSYLTVVPLLVMMLGCIPTSEEAPQAEGEPMAQPAPTPESAEVAAEPQAPVLLPESDEEEPAPAAPAESASPEALIEEWRTMAQEPLINMGEPRLMEIAAALQNHGVEHLDPILDMLSDPESSKEEQVFALVTLQSVVSPDMKDRLISMAAEGRDTRTQGIAIQLLGQLEDPSLKPVFEKYAQSDEEFVRFPALQGLAKLGSEDAQNTLHAMYFEQEDNWPLQDRVVQTLALTPAEAYEDMFISAASNMMLEHRSRQAAVLALGEIGVPGTIERLESMKEDIQAGFLLDLVDQSIGRIRERHNMTEDGAAAAAETESPE